MTTDATPTSRPGINVGSTSEFSLFFRVKPGSENDLRLPGRQLLSRAQFHETPASPLFDQVGSHSPAVPKSPAAAESSRR